MDKAIIFLTIFGLVFFAFFLGTYLYVVKTASKEYKNKKQKDNEWLENAKKDLYYVELVLDNGEVVETSSFTPKNTRSTYFSYKLSSKDRANSYVRDCLDNGGFIVSNTYYLSHKVSKINIKQK